jgi:hypothetical protein
LLEFLPSPTVIVGNTAILIAQTRGLPYPYGSEKPCFLKPKSFVNKSLFAGFNSQPSLPCYPRSESS